MAAMMHRTIADRSEEAYFTPTDRDPTPPKSGWGSIKASIQGDSHDIKYSDFHGDYMDQGVASISKNLVRAYALRQLGAYKMRIKKKFVEDALLLWHKRAMHHVILKYFEMKENNDRASFLAEDELSSLRNQVEVSQELLKEARLNEERLERRIQDLVIESNSLPGAKVPPSALSLTLN